MTEKLSRRQFVGTVASGAAMLGAVAGATTLIPQVAAATQATGSKALAGGPVKAATTAQVPSSWSATADVVVVGYGGSGAISAITAFDAGANVLILEKTPSFASLGVSNPSYSGGGGSTSMNGGHFDYPSDPTLGATYLYNTSWGATPLAVCEAWATIGSQIPAWLTNMGIPHTLSTGGATFPNVPGASTMNGGAVTGGGVAFFKYLDGLVQTRGIPILFNAPATDLIQNPTTGEILGVKALANNSEVMNIRANKAVILSTGGIEYNEQLKLNFLRAYPTHFYGWQFSTGDGLIMAQNAGAGVWHTDCVGATLCPWFPQYPIAFGGGTPSQDGWIYVDKHGKRYLNETATFRTNTYMNLSDFDLSVPEYTRIPTFIIFDETCRKAGAIASGSAGTLPAYIDPRPKWSSDNSVEIANGWILKGADIPSLVAAINGTTYTAVPPGTGNTASPSTITVNINANDLVNTINAYNSACAAKVDSQFGRSAATLVPVQTPPYYAMPMWPGGEAAFAGPIRNERGQVCDANFKPIPRLYSAGELGSVRGSTVTGISQNGELIISGQISGHNAATEESWTS
jgi:succinate dehydrogenase/fumarate reductase flavoprotein subunit